MQTIGQMNATSNEAPKFPNQIPASKQNEHKNNTFPPPKSKPTTMAKPDAPAPASKRYTRSKTQIISSSMVAEAKTINSGNIMDWTASLVAHQTKVVDSIIAGPQINAPVLSDEDTPRLTVSQLKQNLMSSRKETVKVSETSPKTTSKNVVNRLKPAQMTVLEKSLSTPKKPKNKYRRADTSPGLFGQDMGAQMDDLFENFNESMISRTVDDSNVGVNKTTTDKVDEIKKHRPRAPSNRRPPTRWTGNQ